MLSEVRSLTVGVIGVTEEAALFSSGEPGPPTPVGLSATRKFKPAHAAAALRAPRVRSGDGELKATYLHVEIVLDRERDGITERKMDGSVMHKSASAVVGASCSVRRQGNGRPA